MTRDLIEEQLREWGSATLGRHVPMEDRDSGPGSHPISRAREFAPGTRKRAAMRLAGRDGRARRKLMANAINEGLPKGVTRISVAPQWSCDPVRCTPTRTSGPVTAVVDVGVPKHLQWVEDAMMQLYRQNTRRGLVLRIEYTGFGFQSDKAIQVGAALGETMTVRQYRMELDKAREWLRGRIAA